MKVIGSAIWSVPRAIGHGVRRVFSLVEDEDLRAVYGDHPNGTGDGVTLSAQNMAANMIASNGTAAM
jgi:hypothetical protein